MDDYQPDSGMESNNNDSSDEENVASGFDILPRMNKKLDAEKLSGDVRTKRGLDLVLCVYEIWYSLAS